MKKSIDQAIQLEAAQYHIGFEQFLARTDQKQVALRWFREQFNNRSDIRRVLSIGCGEGSFELALLKTLPNVQSYVGIEPNPSHISTFRQHIENEQSLSQLDIKFIQARFEEVGLRPGFDLVLISQSLYYPRDKQAAIEKAFELLDVKGELIIYHTMGDRGIDQLKHEFASYQYRYTGETLLKDLQQTRIPYQAEVLPSTIQIQDLPIPLLEFMLERTVSAKEHEQAVAYLHKHCPDGHLDHPLLAVRISASLSAEAYRDDYRTFRDLTDTIPVVRAWVQRLLNQKRIQAPLAWQQQENHPAKHRSSVKKILSIGCGNGLLDKTCFLDQLDSVCSYVGLDTNQEHLQECHKRLNDSEMDVTLHLQSFQDFRTDERYDLIIISHMLYYLPERKFALSKACTLLNEHGTLVILHQTDRGVNALQKRYGRTLHAYNTVELANDLDTLGIPYLYEELDSYVNLETISDSLIRFFAEGAVTTWQANDMRQYLLRQYPEKRMHHPIGTFVISAQNFQQAVYPRLLSEAAYAQCFDEFLVRSKQHAKIIEWVGKQTLIDLNGVQRMLSVGCGTGAFDLEFAQSLPNLQELVLIEPNVNHLAALKKNAMSAATSFTTHIKAGTLNEYNTGEYSGDSFDLILFAHSLYYITDITDILKQAVSMLSEQGQLLLLHEPQYGGMHQLMTNVGVFGRISLTAQHLEHYISELGFAYQIDTVPVALDLHNTSEQIVHFLLEREPTGAEMAVARTLLLDLAPDGLLRQDSAAIVVQPQANHATSTKTG